MRRMLIAVLLLGLSVASKSQEIVIDLDYGLDDAKTVAVNGATLTYIEKGEGPPVVLVHGGFSDFRYWEELIEEGATRFRMIAPSLRDYFPNTPASEDSSGTPYTDVEDLIAFIEALDIAPVHLLGHSGGGHVSLVLATMRPDLVRSLMLEEGGFISEGAAASEQALADFVPVFEQYFAYQQGGETDRAVAHFIDFVTGRGTFGSASPSYRQLFLDNAPAFGRRPNAPLSCQAVSQVRLPVLLLLGELSPARIHSMMSAVQACLPAVDTVVIRNASHGVHSANPPEFNRVVLEFLSDK